MNHSFPQSQEDFVQQLVYLDENIKELTNLYISSTPIQERLKHFFSLYLMEVEELLKINKEKSLKSFSKVYIGTKVTVLYDDEHETEDYVICFPEHSDPDSGCISFLSPVGRQLLLKKVGEKLSLKIPTGDLPVTIQEITYAGSTLSLEGNLKQA
ncbi:GreA/GreB family elongation factor [Neobacillus sp. Marseille-QA0830]